MFEEKRSGIPEVFSQQRYIKTGEFPSTSVQNCPGTANGLQPHHVARTFLGKFKTLLKFVVYIYSDMRIQQEKIRKLVERRAQSKLGGGQKRIDAQHQKGKRTARERLDRKLSLSFVV